MTNEQKTEPAPLPSWAVVQPPVDGLDERVERQKESRSAWFQRRPIPIYIISAYAILQWVAITLYMVEKWSVFMELIRTGALAPLPFAAGFVYPFILFIGGVLVLRMRKSAIYFFGTYLALGLYKVLSQNVSFPGYVDLALVFGILVYCLRLRQQRLLT